MVLCQGSRFRSGLRHEPFPGTRLPSFFPLCAQPPVSAAAWSHRAGYHPVLFLFGMKLRILVGTASVGCYLEELMSLFKFFFFLRLTILFFLNKLCVKFWNWYCSLGVSDIYQTGSRTSQQDEYALKKDEYCIIQGCGLHNVANI